MVCFECHRETEMTIFAARSNLPVLDFQTWQVLVESFRYLGSIVVTRGGTEPNVKTRISKARAALHIC